MSTRTAPALRRLAIVTGASRGLGHGLATALLAPGTLLLTLSRKATVLPAVADAHHEDWLVDLAEAQPVAERLGAWLAERSAARSSTQSSAPSGAAWHSVLFIHNAAALSTPAPLGQVPLSELTRAARVNLEAPLLLSAAFLRATDGWAGERKLLFISSGLARVAMAGAGSYCATKAGLDHLARALALEEAARPGGAKVVSLAPGVIDTDMQVQLRGADPQTFAAHSRFMQLKDDGQLLSPADVAAKVLACLERADFGANPIGDVRELAAPG